MKLLTILMLMLLASGCDPVARKNGTWDVVSRDTSDSTGRTYHLCTVAAQGAWHALDAPPVNAAQLLGMVQPVANRDSSDYFESWFGRADGRLRLCQPADAPDTVITGSDGRKWRAEFDGVSCTEFCRQ